MARINKIEMYLVENECISCDPYPIMEMIMSAFPDNIIEIKNFESKDINDWFESPKFEDGINLNDLDEEFEKEGNKIKWV